MTTYDAIIAPTVKTESCEYRQYMRNAIPATNCVMETIDRHWIKARLASMPRGTQTRLAEHLGIASNMMSKIMSGERRLQQDEIPKLLSFFNARIVTDDAYQRDREALLRGVGRLNKDGLRLLQKQVNEMLETPALLRPDESSEPTRMPDDDQV